jgi:AraC family transcriptional regulator
MDLLQAQRQGEKYPNSTLLKSSKDLGWSTLLAELRSHNRYEGPGAAAPTDADVGVVVRSSDEGLLTFKFAGSWQSTRPRTGSIHLMPIGRTCDEVSIGSANVQVLHLYVPTGVFTGLMVDYNLPAYRDVPSAILVACRTNSSTRSACQCCRR